MDVHEAPKKSGVMRDHDRTNGSWALLMCCEERVMLLLLRCGFHLLDRFTYKIRRAVETWFRSSRTPRILHGACLRGIGLSRSSWFGQRGEKVLCGRGACGSDGLRASTLVACQAPILVILGCELYRLQGTAFWIDDWQLGEQHRCGQST